MSELSLPFNTADSTRKLSKDDINTLPLFSYSGAITLITDKKAAEEAVAALREETVLGFDTETRPSFSKGKSYKPSLIQLAGEKEIFLFHLKWLPLDDDLTEILASPSIIKAGVAIHDDMSALVKLRSFSPAGIVDLAQAAQANNMENRSLRALAACLLGIRISKTEQCSNWGNKELTARQIRYAATDAWAGRAVYMRMSALGLIARGGVDAAP